MEITIPEPKGDKRRKRAECTATRCTNQKIRVIISFCNVADDIDIKVFSYLAKEPETVRCDSPPITVLALEACITTSRHQSAMIRPANQS